MTSLLKPPFTLSSTERSAIHFLNSQLLVSAYVQPQVVVLSKNFRDNNEVYVFETHETIFDYIVKKHTRLPEPERKEQRNALANQSRFLDEMHHDLSVTSGIVLQ